MSIIYVILVGALIGWIAGKLMKGGGFGFIINMIVGIIGGVVGSLIFGELGISFGSGLISDIIIGVIGAVIFLFVISLFKR
ncbi:GlsB/YeaQ/YmgE family stress response membrane protein [Psychroflexus planctonicus]|uniref:Membrane protein n=1 Tax=Psychroflexus planctonicus TaxID=1526575 RepID=A0ABQ1SFH1_9FLAO|nr:GlsB/YeaQ/YmgE family stress response membrane protein [Psychroflexus planctonicus]GGE36762.1 membrane protein [Psychroflexus planctonicus]